MTVLVSGTISIFAILLASDNNDGHPELYDWLLTLPQEVKYIWSASWNWFEVFYLLTRYIPFVSTALLLQSELLPHWLAHQFIYFLPYG